MSLKSTLSKSFIYFSIMFKSEITTTLFVITIILLLLVEIKSIKISNFISLRSLFMLVVITLSLAQVATQAKT